MRSASNWERHRNRLFRIIEVGSDYDWQSRGYDYLNAIAIFLNLTVALLYTFKEIRIPYGDILYIIEQITLCFFAVDYLFRIWTAKYQHEEQKEWKAILTYMTSAVGIIDLLSFLPEYLPFFFPKGMIAFRMVRIVRIFRLFRINSYFDSLNVITAVLKNRRQQLTSSVFIIVTLMIAASLCMYSIEHETQPDVFDNAFSGIWWAASSLLTVGYGDIYPITALGKIFGICITFLGVGVVAIPTGIISAGFVEQYTEMKYASHFERKKDMQFVQILLTQKDDWVGKRVCDLGLPKEVTLSAILREGQSFSPQKNTLLLEGDVIVFGAKPFGEQQGKKE